MEQGLEKALVTASKAAELAADADDARRRKDADDWERENAEHDHAATKRALTDAENAAPGKGRDLDRQRVGEIKSLLAEGGDKAVAKKYGDAALASPEAAKAKTQLAAVRRHERELAQRAVSDTVADAGKQAAQAKQSRTPLRDQAIERQLQRQQDRARDRETGSLGR